MTVVISGNPNLVIVKSSTPPVGPVAPGDIIDYSISIYNEGTSDALDVIFTDPIPAYSSYISSTIVYDGTLQTDPQDADQGHFDAVLNRVQVNIGTLLAGEIRIITFSIEIDFPMAAGTTQLINTATVTSSNTASKESTVVLDIVAAPDLVVTKTAPSVLSYPLAFLNGAVTNSTTIEVVDAQFLLVSQWVYINGTVAVITGITGTTITLDTPVTAGDGAPVDPIIPFVFNYVNNGDAAATNVVLVDVLQAGLVFIAADSGGVEAPAGTVTWNIGTVEAGESGIVRLWARPTAPGIYTNSGDMTSTELPSTPSNTTTTYVGGVQLSKITTTPVVTNGPGGTQAIYIIELINQIALPATGIVVTDQLSPGFTYNSTNVLGGNAARTGGY